MKLGGKPFSKVCLTSLVFKITNFFLPLATDSPGPPGTDGYLNGKGVSG